MRIPFHYVVAAGVAAAIFSAPMAAAAEVTQHCTDNGASATECVEPGNIQIAATPPMVQQPYADGVYPGPYAVPFSDGRH